jgi:hypothetical protein
LRIIEVLKVDKTLEFLDKFKHQRAEKGVHLKVGDNEGKSTNFLLITTDKESVNFLNDIEIFILNGETVESK